MDGRVHAGAKSRRTLRTAERVPGGVAPKGGGLTPAPARRDVVDEATLTRGLGLEDGARAGEQVSHGGQREGVDHPSTVATLRHQTRQPQDGELVRQARGLDVDRREQLVHRAVTLGQQLEHPDAGWWPR